MARENRLIDANALIDWLNKHTGFRGNCEDCTDIDCLDCIIENAIKNAPTVDAAEVVHGRWIEHEDMVESYLADCTEVFYECSVCGGQQVIGETPYCPNCGAKMDGDGNG